MRSFVSFSLCLADFLLGIGGAWASAEGGHEEAASIMPLVWHLINFIILVVAIYYLFGKNIAAFFSERKELIERAIQEAQQTKQEVDQRYQECEARLQGMDLEVAHLRENSEKDIEELRCRLLEETEEAEEKLLQQTRLNIEQEAKKARKNLQAEAALIAISLAEESLKKNINTEDQQRLFREYLSNVGDSN